jgi:hypothetical protein
MDDAQQPTLEERYQHLKLVHLATNRAVEELHRQLDVATERTVVLERQLTACQQNLDQQKQIVIDHLLQSRQGESDLVLEIERLKKLLSEAGIGSND